MKIFTLFLLFALAQPLQAQDPPQGILTEIGIDQKLNEQVALDATFQDESGRSVRIRDYFRGRPLVLSMAYYECPMLCTMVLNGLVKGLRAIPLNVGRDFDVLTISFDPRDKPEIAASKKNGYIKDYGRAGAAAGWHFLTGDESSIRQITESIGYRFKYDTYTKQWAHVAAVVVLTPAGRVSQYLYGIEYSARDLRLSLVEASQGRIGSLVDRVFLYCYHYDPATGKYGLVIMNTLRIGGCATVAALGAFIFLGLRRDRGGQSR